LNIFFHGSSQGIYYSFRRLAFELSFNLDPTLSGGLFLGVNQTLFLLFRVFSFLLAFELSVNLDPVLSGGLLLGVNQTLFLFLLLRVFSFLLALRLTDAADDDEELRLGIYRRKDGQNNGFWIIFKVFNAFYDISGIEMLVTLVFDNSVQNQNLSAIFDLLLKFGFPLQAIYLDLVHELQSHCLEVLVLVSELNLKLLMLIHGLDSSCFSDLSDVVFNSPRWSHHLLIRRFRSKVLLQPSSVVELRFVHGVFEI